MNSETELDVWLCGGGASGTNGAQYTRGGFGGGGGYTTQSTATVSTATVTIGAGGAGVYTPSKNGHWMANAGGVTSFIYGSTTLSADGGLAADFSFDGEETFTPIVNNNGGSGGGGGTGGTNGGNGGSSGGLYGIGQGTTTYMFGDSTLTLYCGGGGGVTFSGGAGGGGDGGGRTSSELNGGDGTLYGAGGGGAGIYTSSRGTSGAGYQGVVFIRKHTS